MNGRFREAAPPHQPFLDQIRATFDTARSLDKGAKGASRYAAVAYLCFQFLAP
jgi:hypothetical protein